MKAEIIFMTAVLGIAGIHLLTMLVEFFKKMTKVPGKYCVGANARSDWYVFFDTSELIGKSAARKNVKYDSTVSSDLDTDEIVQEVSEHQKVFA